MECFIFVSECMGWYRLPIFELRQLGAIHLALPCLGPLALRGTVGARHDGLLRQLSPLPPVVRQDLPVHSAMLSIHIAKNIKLDQRPSNAYDHVDG